MYLRKDYVRRDSQANDSIGGYVHLRYFDEAM